ncbi:hypothetical protein [Corynebacterium uterequi]|uniref:Secreted protein n=1 Tax=Corynebacterium uterequi TaxID=1072256 RepID=A0A0G3HBH2_9CORY|nr:hypothetical protein [Corynebacterium uterequi]AKK10736.1 hypothetical protein CUTER_03640 [Corynebacterium uterequi]
MRRVYQMAAAALITAGLGLGTAMPAGAVMEAVNQQMTPDQDVHRSTFLDEACNPATDAKRHPWEQWVTDEWDRYNGTTSFTNTSDRDIKFSLEVTEGVNESVKAMSSGNTWDVFLKGVKSSYGIVEVSQWAVGDKLGPVIVKPGETVRADYGVHMKSFIGRVRTCDARTGKWKSEPYFGHYHGEGPSTRFVVWHRTSAEGAHSSNVQYVQGQRETPQDSAAATLNP